MIALAGRHKKPKSDMNVCNKALVGLCFLMLKPAVLFSGNRINYLSKEVWTNRVHSIFQVMIKHSSF